MKNFKIIPLSLAVAVAMTSFSSLATNSDIEELTNRIKELESKLETDYVYDQQQAILTPETEVPLGLVFSGYARYGAHYASGDNRYVQVGSSGAAVGRLGNEANGGEIQFAKAFKTDAGAIWDVVFMLDQWGVDQWSSPGGVNLKKAYAGVTNVFASQPDVYMWAGRDFHQRPQQGLNDYFWMSHDGQGGGFHNFDFGGAKFDLAFVAQVDSGDGGALGNDNGRYAITSKLHSIDAGIGNLDIYVNYGFASTEADTAESYEWVFNDTTGAPEKKIIAATKVSDKNTWQIGATLGLGLSNKLVMKYTDGGDNSAFDLAGDKKVGYVSIEGGINPSDRMAVDYLASYKTFAGEDTDDKNEYSAIVRPMYNWDDTHSTWLEAGYAMEDFANGDEKTGWKVTLSQNISMGGLPWSRPMLRFYATVGDVQSKTGSVTGPKQDTVSVGAMWEAWW